MTTDTELLSQWYEALYEEDSKQVKALLAAHPSLLKVGWGNEASQFVWKGRPWKERTALHVGARRGNAELVEQVLKLCKVVVRKHSTKEGEDGRRSTSQPDLAESEEAQTNDNNIADRSQDNTTGEGDRQPAKSTRSADAGQSLSTSDGQPAEKTGSADGSLGFKNGVSSTSRSEPDEVDQSREIARLAVDDSSIVREHPNDKERTFLADLEACKDGSYQIDAFAMAVLHGNRKIILMLLYAIGGDMILPALDVTEESEEDRDHRAKLRGATEQVVREFRVEHSWQCAEYLKWYESRTDFNFLPWQEYLFHSLLCYDSSNVPIEWAVDFARALWTAVRSCPGSTWRFLLKLQDGQGRTPLIAAMDSGYSLKIVDFFGKREEEHEAAECAMAACDGAGRTAIHFAFARDCGQGLAELLEFVGGAKKLAPLFRAQWQHPIPNLVRSWTNNGLDFAVVNNFAVNRKLNGFGTGTVHDSEGGIDR